MTAPATLGAAVAATAARLAAAGIPRARAEARLLAAHALDVGPETVFAHPERPLTPPQRERLDALARRRAAREPLAYITGRKDFWTLTLTVTPATLIPRPESEALVEAVLARLPQGRPLRLLDLGTGSGCLLLALLSERPDAWGLGVDSSAAALRVAADNARATGLAHRTAFVQGDWAAAVAGRFDAIVVNPPYVAAADLRRLEPEVARFEPAAALAGGADGLAAYRRLMPMLAERLADHGVAAVELGYGQAAAVADLARQVHLQVAEIKEDLAGISRCLVAVAAESPLHKKKAWKPEAPCLICN